MIKPLKECVSKIKDHLNHIASLNANQRDFIEIGGELSPVAVASQKLETYMKEKRSFMLNKEVKARSESLRELAEKLAKRYQGLASGLKGFNP